MPWPFRPGVCTGDVWIVYSGSRAFSRSAALSERVSNRTAMSQGRPGRLRCSLSSAPKTQRAMDLSFAKWSCPLSGTPSQL